MLRRLLGETAIYGLGQASQQLLALLTLPIFARLLSPADYGMLETLATVTAVTTIIASLSLATGMHRRYFDYSAEQAAERRNVIVTTLTAVGLFDLVLLAVTAPFCEPIMRYLQGGPGSGQLLLISLLTAVSGIWLGLCQEVHRLTRRPWHFTAVAVTNSLMWMGCGLYYVYWAKAGVLGYVWGGLLAVLLTLPISLWTIRRELRGRPDRADLIDMLQVSLPWIPTAASAWLMGLADRLVLNHWVDLTQIGYYGVGQKTTRLIGLLLMAFGSAWSPFIFSLFSEDPQRERQVRARITTLYLAALGFAGVVLTGLAPEIITVLASAKFLPAVAVVAPLCISQIGYGLTTTTMTALSLVKKTGHIATFSLITGILNVGLNLVLVPSYGTVGSAWATAISFAVLNVLYYRMTQKLYPTPFEPRRLLTTAALTLLAIGALPMIGSLWGRLGIVLAFPLATVACGGVDHKELQPYVSRFLAKT
jgi:O-antigen/teichoic acid export membrane protein